MKKILVGILIGLFIGLLIGGIFWSKKYISLSKKYDQRGKGIELLKEKGTKQ